VKFFPNPRDMVIEALKPAVPREILLDERNHRIVLRVATDDLAIVIGRKGQNARLTSRLIGWRLDIEEFKAEGDDPVGAAVSALIKAFDLPEATARRLVDMGINSPAVFEGVTEEDLVEHGFSAEEAQDILARTQQ